MKNTQQEIERIKSNGFDIDFGTVFNHAFETYKKIALNAGAALLLFVILFSMIVVGIVIGLVGIGTSTEDLQRFNIINFSVGEILAYVAFLIIATSLGSPFTAGLINMARNAVMKKEVSVSNAFEYYNNSYFKNIFLATLIISSFTTLVDVGLELVGYKILGVIINLFASFLTFLTIPLLIFGDLKPGEAIKGSIVIVAKKFFIILGLLIVTGLFCCLGIFAFCIGIFFTLPLVNAMTYSIYASIIPDDENDDETNIQTELIESMTKSNDDI